MPRRHCHLSLEFFIGFYRNGIASEAGILHSWLRLMQDRGLGPLLQCYFRQAPDRGLGPLLH